jgi:hypothetical protein
MQDKGATVHQLRVCQLDCTGVGRFHDPEAPEQSAKTLLVTFNRSPTNDEMRFIHECISRAANFAGDA